jgi:mannose-6-phosphate isomerase-like protein (cupin superfamily)
MQSYLKSEDSRRKLYEFGEGSWVCAKYLEIKQDCVIGDHYHLNKDECFLLVEGEMGMTLGGEVSYVKAPAVINVPRGVKHTFRVKAGSKIVGLVSEKFDVTDDHI